MTTTKFALRVTFLSELREDNKYRFALISNDTIKHSVFFDNDEEYQFDNYMGAFEHLPVIVHNILNEDVRIEIIEKEINVI